jgi:hypothetical protein
MTNRDYMRRWRAVRSHRATERAREKARGRIDRRRQPCELCHSRRAHSVIARLIATPAGFQEALFHYCGQC